jgi:hypothetical protein
MRVQVFTPLSCVPYSPAVLPARLVRRGLSLDRYHPELCMSGFPQDSNDDEEPRQRRSQVKPLDVSATAGVIVALSSLGVDLLQLNVFERVELLVLLVVGTATVADEDQGLYGQLLRALGLAGTESYRALDSAKKWSDEREVGWKGRAALELALEAWVDSAASLPKLQPTTEPVASLNATVASKAPPPTVASSDAELPPTVPTRQFYPPAPASPPPSPPPRPPPMIAGQATSQGISTKLAERLGLLGVNSPDRQDPQGTPSPRPAPSFPPPPPLPPPDSSLRRRPPPPQPQSPPIAVRDSSQGSDNEAQRKFLNQLIRLWRQVPKRGAAVLGLVGAVCFKAGATVVLCCAIAQVMRDDVVRAGSASFKFAQHVLSVSSRCVIFAARGVRRVVLELPVPWSIRVHVCTVDSSEST